MKKRFGFVIVCLLLIELCMYTQQTIAGVVDNSISASEVKQYYFFDCDKTDCQVLFREIGDGATADTVPGQEVVTIDPEIEILNQVQDDNEEQQLTSVPSSSVVQDDKVEYPLQSIRINEIVSAPETGEKEWIELYNATVEPIDLQDWSIEEGAGTKTSLSGQIAANGYLVFETKNLNNSGDLILLKDATGKVIDQVVYGDWPDNDTVDNFLASGKGESLALYENEYVVNPQITKGTINIYDRLETLEDPQVEIVIQADPPLVELVDPEVVEPAWPVGRPAGAATEPPIELMPPAYQFSDEIIISEFLPAPATGSEEWIELYNAGLGDVDLRGWSIDDAVGGSSPYIIADSRIIKAQNYLLFPQAKTKLQLNNTSDEVRLIDPDQKVIDAVSYVKTQSDVSWSRIDDDWIETESLTPGLDNVEDLKDPLMISAVDEDLDVEMDDSVFQNFLISEVAALDLRTQVMIEAVVTVLPGTFSKNIIYVQDATGGIQIYYDAANWPALELGSEVIISGTISQSLGEKRILIKSAADVFVKETNQVILPFKIDTGMVNQSLVGSLVEIEATLFEKDGSTWFVTDSIGGMKVYLKKGAQISSTLFKVNDNLKLTGVLVQSNSEYSIQPRSEQDIVNLSLIGSDGVGASIETQATIVPGLTQKKVLVGLGVGAGVLGAINLFLALKKYIPRRKIRGYWYRFKNSFQN